MKSVKQTDILTGSIPKQLLLFFLPIWFGTLFQQLYNTADTLIVGNFVGTNALAAVGATGPFVNLLVGLFVGLCSGAGVVIAQSWGAHDPDAVDRQVHTALVLSAAVGALLTVLGLVTAAPIMRLLGTPDEILPDAALYLRIYFLGMIPQMLYNMGTNILRAIGDSKRPLYFLIAASLVNIVLDVVFIAVFGWGVMGAALATVLAQYAAGVGLALWTWQRCPDLRVGKADRRWDRNILRQLWSLSFFTCLQQSVMNFGILLVQGLVNSFGSVVMAAFAVAVKIDTLAYMPVQDFGNAYATFVAQNYGAGQRGRIKAGTKWALFWVLVFCLAIGGLVCCFAPQLLAIFVGHDAQEVISVGTGYLRIEGSCYLGIGILFLLYGYFRAVDRPAVSLVLTICSLGTRVALAYLLSASPAIGVTGIWAAIPIGWFFADTVGGILWRKDIKRSHP